MKDSLVLANRLAVACALAIVICVLTAVQSPTPPASAVPANDNLANAIAITTPSWGGIVAISDTTGATVEGAEDVSHVPCPQIGITVNMGATVWYKWTAPAIGLPPGGVTFDTIGSSFNTVMAIYSGTGFPLNEIRCNNDFQGEQSGSNLPVSANTTYYIQIGGLSGVSGSLVLNMTFSGANIVVNATGDANISDSQVTLTEAILYARGGTLAAGLGRPMSAQEQEAVLKYGSGGGVARDLIHFHPQLFTAPGVPITLGGTLPDMNSNNGDTLSGIGSSVIIDGGGLNFTCLPVSGNNNRIDGLLFFRCDGASFPAGVLVSGSNNVIGATTIAAQQNQFRRNGVGLAFNPPGTGNRVIAGQFGIGTGQANDLGVAITGASNFVGGSAAGEGNTFATSTFEQVVIRGSGASGNTVLGNQIGGTSVTSNWGVRIDTSAHDNVIGGANAGEGNVISGANIGVYIQSGPNNQVLGNKIGVDAAGTAARANNNGVWVEGPATGAKIGGTTAGSGNVISGNTNSGLLISGSNGNIVQGNYIGTNAAGTGALPNGSGIGLYDSAGNAIGGTGLARNLISGNTTDGVLIDNSGGNNTPATTLVNNVIGMNATATGALGNGGNGVHIQNSAGHQVGSTTAGQGNVIAFNGAAGVRVDGGGSPASTGNTIRVNSIHDNVGLGIDLTGGANNGIAPPVILATGSASGTACASCTVDVYSDSDTEGRIFQGTATADPSGNWSYPGAVIGPKVTAIATNASGGSSEFSAAVACVDADLDGLCTSADNCPAQPNVNQENNDGDSMGDVCDTDDDNDTVSDGADNCPLTANQDQANADGDGLGDICDADDDNDTVADGSDNCPFWANTPQALPVWSVPPGDPDCDGFSSSIETFVGSDPAKHCSANATRDNEPPPDHWSADFDDNAVANTLDLVGYAARLNTPANYGIRWDLNANGQINTLDLARYSVMLNQRCDGA